MALTMHSHSGQFCPGHARDELEAIVRHAASLGYGTMALTEHMPRLSRADLYPEELADPLDPSRPADAVAAESLAGMGARHAEFLAEALRLRELFHPRPGGAREEEMEEGKEGRPQKAVLHVLIGFEGEWIRAADYGPYIRTLAAHPAVDFWIGSLHHVRGVPIDFDRAAYEAAIAACEEDGGGVAVYEDEDTDTDDAASALTNGNGHVNGASKRRTTRLHGEQALFAAYYDEQHGLLTEMEPRVVGHFDLIRLLARDGDAADVKRNWPAVWRRVLRNLAAAAKYGGWLECNSSALRKGLAEPYPGRDIAEAWLALGGRFTLSDDSHGIAQVATNYGRALAYLESLGVTEVWTFERIPREAAATPVVANGNGVAAKTNGAGGGYWENTVLVEKAVQLAEIRKSFP